MSTEPLSNYLEDLRREAQEYRELAQQMERASQNLQHAIDTLTDIRRALFGNEKDS
jgi:hypothetical protein